MVLIWLWQSNDECLSLKSKHIESVKFCETACLRKNNLSHTGMMGQRKKCNQFSVKDGTFRT